MDIAQNKNTGEKQKKRPRGRPKGSKNKKLLTECRIAPSSRGPGTPLLSGGPGRGRPRSHLSGCSDRDVLTALLYHAGVPVAELAERESVKKPAIYARLKRVGKIPGYIETALGDMYAMLRVANKAMHEIFVKDKENPINNASARDVISAWEALMKRTIDFQQVKILSDIKAQATLEAAKAGAGAQSPTAGMTQEEQIQAAQESTARILAYHQAQARHFARELKREAQAIEAQATVETPTDATETTTEAQDDVQTPRPEPQAEPMGGSEPTPPPTQIDTSPNPSTFSVDVGE